ncbi:hypothetical protein [Nocardia wallacei]|uniref:hypothetical protein n=1 Tax=Nocardia wallacei TaxID=480035 RepID=UPI002457A518|nr:hypothetical protein [Nocardia wallacei]
MITTNEAGVHPATDTGNTRPTTDFGTEARPQLRVEYALRSPRGRWVRSLATVLAELSGSGMGAPFTSEPEVFGSVRAALDAMAEATAIAEHCLAADDYCLELYRRQVRVGSTDATTTVGPWRVCTETEVDR